MYIVSMQKKLTATINFLNKLLNITLTKQVMREKQTKNYEGIKTKLSYKNLKSYVQKYLNNCDICNTSRSKYRVSLLKQNLIPLKHYLTLMKSYIYIKNSFITLVDKSATAIQLEDRNSNTIMKKIRMYL